MSEMEDLKDRLKTVESFLSKEVQGPNGLFVSLEKMRSKMDKSVTLSRWQIGVLAAYGLVDKGPSLLTFLSTIT